MNVVEVEKIFKRLKFDLKLFNICTIDTLLLKEVISCDDYNSFFL